MSTPTIRGHQTYIKFFQDGKEQSIDSITDFSVDLESTFMRSKFVGKPIPEGDQSIDGWSGSFNMEVRDSKIESFIDAIVESNLNGIGVTEQYIIDTENYPNGETVSYVYYDVQFSIGKQAKGLDAKVTKSVKFQASGRNKI